MPKSLLGLASPWFIWLVILVGATFTGLFFYSFTQVDLNLTLSRINLISAFQDFFQYTGYYQRPLSTFLYASLVMVLFVNYGVLLILGKKNSISYKQVIILVTLTVIVLLFSYPAFSYDLFNYMFDARIVTEYGQNPYFHKALDYPLDPWTTFMRWTHRTYPYGPSWLAVTIPLSFFGSGYFLITLYLFKLLMAISYLGACFWVYKITTRARLFNGLTSLILFAMNPLIIVESLVSAHNDIVMMAVALCSIYSLIKKKYFISFVLLAFSIGIKFATVFLVPAYLYYILFQNVHEDIRFRRFILLSIVGMTVAIVGASVRTQFQPWYLLYILPFVSLLKFRTLVVLVMSCISFFALLMYAPYIYLGHWDPPVQGIVSSLVLFGVVIPFVLGFIYLCNGGVCKRQSVNSSR